jgi:hypothetical protein
MKKLMICILCFVSIKSFSQVRLGVQGSYSSLNFWQTDGYSGEPSLENTWQINGWQAGLVAEFDLGYSGVEFQPSLLYAMNGSHLRQVQGFVDNPTTTYDQADTKLTIYYLRVPLNILYSYRVSPKFKVYAGVGPYIAKTLGGTEVGTYEASTYSNGGYAYTTGQINNKVQINGNTSYNTLGQSNVPSIDIGMDILAGFQYKKLQISASWNRGFTYTYHTNYTNMGNQFWNFSLGYIIFGHERKPKL